MDESKVAGTVGIEIGIREDMVLLKVIDSEEGSEIEFALTAEQARGMAVGIMLALRRIGNFGPSMGFDETKQPN